MLVSGSVPSAAVHDTIRFDAYLPEGYGAGAERYPSVYLLHGRGDSAEAWHQVVPDLDELIASGAIPPVIAVMPDAPWGERAGFYVDSLHTGFAIETAFTGDLVSHIDRAFRTIPRRESRAVGGFSMGGAGAVRLATAHPDLFSAAIALSPASYVPLPPLGSSAREYGAFGLGGEVFDAARYEELNYPGALAALDGSLPIRMFIAVGDAEYQQPDARDATHDLDYVAATLYNRVRRAPGITSAFRVYGGGHDWSVWRRGLREGLEWIAVAG